MYDRMRAYIFAHTYSELRLSLSSHVETSASGTKATVPNDVTVKDTSSRPVSTDLVMHPLDNEGNGHRYGCAHITRTTGYADPLPNYPIVSHPCSYFIPHNRSPHMYLSTCTCIFSHSMQHDSHFVLLFSFDNSPHYSPALKQV